MESESWGRAIEVLKKLLERAPVKMPMFGDSLFYKVSESEYQALEKVKGAKIDIITSHMVDVHSVEEYFTFSTAFLTKSEEKAIFVRPHTSIVRLILLASLAMMNEGAVYEAICMIRNCLDKGVK